MNWIGIWPDWKRVAGKRGPEVTFNKFRYFDTNGPDMRKKARRLAARLKKAVHGVINLTPVEQAEAQKLLELAKK